MVDEPLQPLGGALALLQHTWLTLHGCQSLQTRLSSVKLAEKRAFEHRAEPNVADYRPTGA